jgi:hypothetical protein
MSLANGSDLPPSPEPTPESPTPDPGDARYDQPPSRLSRLVAPLAFLAPGGIWVALFLLLPALLLLLKSFVTPEGGFTFANYSRIFAPNEAGDLIYLAVIWRSLFFSTITTLLCLLIGFPVAYWIAVLAPKRWQNTCCWRLCCRCGHLRCCVPMPGFRFCGDRVCSIASW